MRRQSALRASARPRWFRPVAIVVAGFLVLAAIGYLALKLTPDWFASDRFGSDVTCRPSDAKYKDCLDAAKAQADDRRGVTTATLALFVGVLSAVGAFYTARTFALNRANAARRHELDR